MRLLSPPNGPELSGALCHQVKRDCGGELPVPCSSLRGRICSAFHSRPTAARRIRLRLVPSVSDFRHGANGAT